MRNLHAGSMCYPPPEATHEEVCADTHLFHQTLNNLLTHIGVKLKIPKVGGIEVDLHLLYQQVTHMGGLELVISRKQWVIVCEPFNFPSSFTNKSFVMKKLYVNALHHYEQLYFYRRSGPLVPAPMGPANEGAVSGGAASPSLPLSGKRRPSEWEPCASTAGEGGMAILPAGSNTSIPLGLKDGTKFTGTIDSCFDAGYMITLTVGGQRLKGMLYKNAPMGAVHTPGHGRAQSNSQELDSSAHNTAKRARLAQPDGSAGMAPPVRPARTPFQFFQLGIRKGDLLQHAKDGEPISPESLPRLISDLWHQMGWEQRKPFEDLAAKDRTRFQREWGEWHARGGSGHVREYGDGAEVGTPPSSARGGGGGGSGTPAGAASSSHMPHPVHPVHRHQSGGPGRMLHHSFSQQVQLSGGGSGGCDTPTQHRLSKSASMPRPAGLPTLEAAAGFHFLPSDLAPEEYDHLCHFASGGAKDDRPHGGNMLGTFGLGHGGGGGAAAADVPFGEELSAADFGEQVEDEYALAMDVLGGDVCVKHDGVASAGMGDAGGDIDLFGCHTTVQVSSASRLQDKAHPCGRSGINTVTADGRTFNAGMPADFAAMQGRVAGGQHAKGGGGSGGGGNDNTSSAGTPSDDHMSHMFQYGMLQYEVQVANDLLTG